MKAGSLYGLSNSSKSSHAISCAFSHDDPSQYEQITEHLRPAFLQLQSDRHSFLHLQEII